jgi:hypothetical protein
LFHIIARRSAKTLARYLPNLSPLAGARFRRAHDSISPPSPLKRVRLQPEGAEWAQTLTATQAGQSESCIGFSSLYLSCSSIWFSALRRLRGKARLSCVGLEIHVQPVTVCLRRLAEHNTWGQSADQWSFGESHRGGNEHRFGPPYPEHLFS